MGALHPYFPDLPKDFDYNQLVQQPPKPSTEEKFKYEEMVVEPGVQLPEEIVELVEFQTEERQLGKEDEETIEVVETEHTTLSKRLAASSEMPWRPSGDPSWTGPDDFEWSLEWTPPRHPNHRWLRVPDDKALNRTPVAYLTYDVWGPTYENWAIATQQHYSLLENIETEKLDLYKFDHPWDMKGERLRINFVAILGSDILDTDVFHWSYKQSDEDMLVLTLPHDTGRREFSSLTT